MARVGGRSHDVLVQESEPAPEGPNLFSSYMQATKKSKKEREAAMTPEEKLAEFRKIAAKAGRKRERRIGAVDRRRFFSCA